MKIFVRYSFSEPFYPPWGNGKPEVDERLEFFPTLSDTQGKITQEVEIPEEVVNHWLKQSPYGDSVPAYLVPEEEIPEDEAGDLLDKAWQEKLNEACAAGRLPQAVCQYLNNTSDEEFVYSTLCNMRLIYLAEKE